MLGDSKIKVLQEEGALDGAAATLSSLCLLHCLLLPLSLVLIPGFGTALEDVFHAPAWLHWGLLLLAAPVSVVALWRGKIRHGEARPAVLAVAGFALMAAGAALHGNIPLEPILTVFGGMVVAYAHWRNWGLQRPA